MEQQRGEGRVYGPSGAVWVGEGHHRTSKASAEEARSADGRRDARLHQPEDHHFDSADRHVTLSVTPEVSAESCSVPNYVEYNLVRLNLTRAIMSALKLTVYYHCMPHVITLS